MKQKLVEQYVLFASVVKWFFLASFIGIIVGFSTSLFLNILNWCSLTLKVWPGYFLLLPVGLFLSSFLVKTLAPDAEGHGTEKVIEAVHKRFGKIPIMVVPVKLLATIITLAVGGSAGKEGPCAQIGAGLASIFSDVFRINNTDRRKLVICGVSAGFATVFGTPVAGALFGVEVLAVGKLEYQVLFPSFVAGIVGFQTATMMGASYFHHAVDLGQVFNRPLFIEAVLAGVAFGLCSFIFIEFLHGIEYLSEKLKWWQPYKALLGGALLIPFGLISTKYLGLGLDTIENTLTGVEHAHSYEAFIKMLTTSVTLNFGGSGGIITPIFFIGSTFGSFLGSVFHLNSMTFAALGMVGLLSGCANTPIAASVMAIELFGPAISPYAAIVCAISFLITGHRSVYPSQVLSMSKSDSLELDLGNTMDEVEANNLKKYLKRRQAKKAKNL